MCIKPVFVPPKRAKTGYALRYCLFECCSYGVVFCVACLCVSFDTVLTLAMPRCYLAWLRHQSLNHLGKSCSFDKRYMFFCIFIGNFAGFEFRFRAVILVLTIANLLL